jgi:hypothetical protein
MDFNNLCITWVLMHLLSGFGIHLHLWVISCLIKLDQLKCLTALQPLAFHYKALHVVIVSFPCGVRHVLMLVVYYCIYTIRLLLRRSVWGLPWRTWRSLGVRLFSQLPVEEFCVYLSAARYSMCYNKDYRSCNKCLILSLRFYTVFLVFAKSMHVWNLILAHM